MVEDKVRVSSDMLVNSFATFWESGKASKRKFATREKGKGRGKKLGCSVSACQLYHYCYHCCDNYCMVGVDHYCPYLVIGTVYGAHTSIHSQTFGPKWRVEWRGGRLGRGGVLH